MLFFYLVGFVILVSGGILIIALPCFRSSPTTETSSDSFEQHASAPMHREMARPAFPLPKPPPLNSNPRGAVNL